MGRRPAASRSAPARLPHQRGTSSARKCPASSTSWIRRLSACASYPPSSCGESAKSRVPLSINVGTVRRVPRWRAEQRGDDLPVRELSRSAARARAGSRSDATNCSTADASRCRPSRNSSRTNAVRGAGRRGPAAASRPGPSTSSATPAAPAAACSSRMHGVQGHQAAHARGRPQAQVEAEPAAQLMADDDHAIELERVQQRENVVHERRGAVALAWRLAPAEAAQIRTENPVPIRGFTRVPAPRPGPAGAPPALPCPRRAGCRPRAGRRAPRRGRPTRAVPSRRRWWRHRVRRRRSRPARARPLVRFSRWRRRRRRAWRRS